MSDKESIYEEEEHRDGKQMHKAVSILHMVAMSFFYVCAGPFGQGEAIGAGGAKYTFIFTILIPIAFSIPLAMMSSEQATRLPMCGGCVEWGYILGRWPGHANAYIRTLCSIFDNAIYPVMTCDYLAGLVPGMDNIGYRTIVVLLVNILVVVMNISGLETVGYVSFALTILIIAPFFLFFCFGASAMTNELVFAEKPAEYGPVDWSLLISTLVWQYSGFDTISALAEETKDPKRTFPIALCTTILIVTLVYLLPTVSGVSIQPDLDAWTSGAFNDISLLLPHCENGWLGYWISIAGVLSALSLLNVAISCTGRETYAGGLFNAFPFSKYLSRLDNNMKGEPIPIVAFIVMSVLTIPFSFFNFEMLVEWSGLLTVLEQLVQVASFIACRFPKNIRKMKRERAVLLSHVEAVELSSIVSSRAEDPNQDSNLDELITDEELYQEETTDDKFIIPGGWIGVAIVLVPICGVSLFLCVVCGWMSLVISLAMVIGMFVLKAIEFFILYLIETCKRKRARARRERRSEISNSARVSETGD